MIKIGKSASNISVYTCQPKTKKELKKIIQERIKQEGPKCDLNDIDVSLVEDMSYMFAWSCFDGYISEWNTSSVKIMNSMFYRSKFNGDISKWDISKVKDMSCMFYRSKFNQDISNWKINKDCYMVRMFEHCPIKEEFKQKSTQQP